MARNKIFSRKKRYAREIKSNLPVPTWVTMRTARKVRQHPGKRNWRTHSIKR
ncbi:MAG: 50S ribosomal protein L39e [Candidatus Heimdallarchaeota archaeon]|nr:50S ribosomal protein L39e [Candidatus Heimdallarchaeota archaeon]MDH5645016.1 50S ribosomal protein L39e [Candidatus Heimdallarchaeota archaeon]